jgi:hypothetical protein
MKNLGLVAIRSGQSEEAGQLLYAALERRGRFHDDVGRAECLEGLGQLAARLGFYDNAVTLLATADEIRQAHGTTASAADRAEVTAAVTASRRALAPAEFDHAWRRGQPLDSTTAIDEAARLLDLIAPMAST